MERTVEIEQKIDSDFAGRCWDGLWGNPLCVVLTAFTTNLFQSHQAAALPLFLLFGVATTLRLLVLTRRKWLTSRRICYWRECSEAIVLMNGATWGGACAYFLYTDGYGNPNVVLLMLYISAVATAGTSLFVHNPKLIRVYLAVLYTPACVVQIVRPAEQWWAPFCIFGLYCAFVAVHGTRNHRDYISRLLDNQALLLIAKQDFLTGLPNRFCLERQLEAEASHANETGSTLALLFIDLNGFKKINDNYSHEVGDQFLCALARTIQKASGPDAMVSRLGGDEFAVLLTGSPKREEVRQRAVKLLDAITVPVHIAGHSLRGGASVGISFYPEDTTDPGALLRIADRAMYSAKQRGGNRFQFVGEMEENTFTFVAPEKTGHALAHWATILHAVSRADHAGFPTAMRNGSGEERKG